VDAQELLGLSPMGIEAYAEKCDASSMRDIISDSKPTTIQKDAASSAGR
jgi:hypothetical protein